MKNDTPRLGRRGFLTSAALGGATIVGASALGALDADAAFAAPGPSLDPAISQSAFAEGRIGAIQGSLLHVAGSHGERHRIQLTNATSVWKARPTTADDIEVGDGLYARGVPMPDGTIAADAVWVNIVNLYTTIRGIERQRLHLAHNNHALVGNTIPETSASYAGGALTSDLSRLRIGQPAQVLGAWRPADDSIDLVRVTVGH
ncbi:cell wall protein [Streptomyces sp. 3MP-14]|uniref:Cell wall protein n=1 Tax=Streptomyces mimosae TaxID=2586635 RepID=A0A5N6AJW1_9ACTN|nr:MULTISPECIES: cell wall protein [Streptomyces]KAB8167858.1 cell wall protein [Streptomyces mimosae]KAB8177494.1 cell wall protein [Streptomyces sp. 3MP-14]